MDKLGDLITEFRKPMSYPEIKVLLTNSDAETFAWMWDFFADPRGPIDFARRDFWTEVLTATVDEFRMLRSAAMAKTKRPPRTSEWASAFLTNHYPERVHNVHEKLQNSFNPGISTRSKLKREKRTLIICFDEARFLCDTSALTGVSIIPPRHGNLPRESSGQVDSDTRIMLYSNIRAMHRALRYLAQKETPQIFALFTDTTSRISNFQPRSIEGSTGGRFLKLPGAGTGLFDPIYVFTSIDAHSRQNNLPISDHRQVAKVERLLKFGRAGWYSLYSTQADSKSLFPRYNETALMDIAVNKLLGGLTERVAAHVLRTQDDDSTRLNWLALLSCRLAIAVGPFSREAEEMVSSHLAVLLKTDKQRHFHKTYYPSEPILREASATITARTGWAPALKALYHHLQNGLSAPATGGNYCPSPPGRTGYWAHTQPVKVRDFLNGWLASPSDDHERFCDALLAANHRTNKTELRRFLDGYVFFNHFVRLDRILSLEAIVGAWNRGAAIMTKENTYSFDHVIPVMLAPRGRKKTAPKFGPLHNSWDEPQLKSACSNVSFILINSRNRVAAVSHKTAYDCTPNKRNFENFDMFGGKNVEFACGGETPKSVFLSIVQDFGPRQEREPYVTIRPRGNRTVHRIYRQINVILKELGPKTYTCLQPESYIDNNLCGEEESDVEHDLDPRMDVVVEESMDEEDEVGDEVPDPALPDDDGEEDKVELPDYSSVLDDDEELGDDEMAGVTKYLRKLRTANFGFLDDVDKEDIPGVKDFLPLVYAGERGEEAEQAEKEWDEATKKYWSLRRAGDCS